MSSGIYEDAGRTEDLVRFYQDYYRDQLGHLANAYPRDCRSLTIQWSELHRAMPSFADDLRTAPHGADAPDFDPLDELHEALYQTDLPIDQDFRHDEFADAHVRLVLPQHARQGLGELRARHRGKYVAIHGQIERVTESTERIRTAQFVCNKCGATPPAVPQPRDELQEPPGCPGSCSGKPNFRLDDDNSDTVDERKLRLSQPPDESDGGGGEELTVYLEDDLAFSDGGRGLMGMAGERVTIHGILKRDKSQTRGRKAKPVFDSYLDAHAIEWDGGVAEDIDTSEHREEIQSHIDSGEAFARLVESTAPGIRGGERLEQIKRGIVLYLFRASRKSTDSGALRGDIHLGMIGDPSTGKTQLLDFIDAVSPRVERLSATDGSGAGLTATAEQDEFAGGKWVLTPGLLPLASGGHAIVDEIDKMSDGVDKLHEAMETQRIHVAKAGMRAKLKTEAGIVIAANPTKGRFQTTGAAVLSEIDLPPALFSRFDILHTLRDRPDEETDGAVADAALSRWQAAAEDGDSDGLARPVKLDTYRAWIALAQECEPRLSDAAFDRLQEWYVEERNTEWDEHAEIIPISARSVLAGARLAEAHARVHLRDEVTIEDAEIAIQKIRAVMGDVYLDDQNRMNVDMITGASGQSYSQKGRREAVRTMVDNHDGPMSVQQIRAQADEKGIEPDKAESDVEHFAQNRIMYEPENNHFDIA